MRQPIFTGVCTALVTPFLDQKVNYPMLEQLLRRQMQAGVSAAVICGTTGESATLSDEEKIELFRRSKAYVGDKMKILAGTGSNSTEHAVRLSREAEKAGADGLLVVSPYYNKATPEGLVAHYTAVAENTSLPILIYNVPSRTGLDIPVAVYRLLSRIPNIVGVKEASTDIGKILKIRRECPEDFAIYAGNDNMTVPVMALGGLGVVSVVSNLLPEQMALMTNAALDGDFDTAADLQCALEPITEALFCEVNPIPVKEALKMLGFDCGGCRLPLTPASPRCRKKLQALLS